jgi:cytoskeletal protein RodZ
MSTISQLLILFIVVVILLGGMWWFYFSMQTPAPVVTTTATTPTQTQPQPVQQNTVSDTSDTGLASDVSNIDTQMSASNTDATSTDQSLNAQ